MTCYGPGPHDHDPLDPTTEFPPERRIVRTVSGLEVPVCRPCFWRLFEARELIDEDGEAIWQELPFAADSPRCPHNDVYLTTDREFPVECTRCGGTL
jgi:hypothetical protein